MLASTHSANSRQQSSGTRALTSKEILALRTTKEDPIIEDLLLPEEIVLFIARQKEGKSTLALQLALDVANGTRAFGKYTTKKGKVLYIDYENRLSRLKGRLLDIGRGRETDDLLFVAWDHMADRDVGLSTDAELRNLETHVRQHQPKLLIIDPLRLALSKETTDERVGVGLVETLSRLHKLAPEMSIVVIHHRKKQQESFSTKLREDPRTWIDGVYGSQALLAHVDSIWGLEEDEEGFTFANVSRSLDATVLRLEKDLGSQRFQLDASRGECFSQKEREAWEKLDAEFSWAKALSTGVPKSTLSRVIRKAMKERLLMQDHDTRLYQKVVSGPSSTDKTNQTPPVLEPWNSDTKERTYDWNRPLELPGTVELAAAAEFQSSKLVPTGVPS